MCDPITIAGIAATVGSTVVNSMATGQANAARNDVLAAERIRQGGLDREAQALNVASQDRYEDFGGQQEIRAQTLGDYFAAPAPDAVNQTAGTNMPSGSSNIEVREMAKQSAKAKSFTDQQAQALGDLRSFGDLLGDTSRMQSRDASLVGQIGGMKRGSSGVIPLELDQASRAGDGLKVFGDILGGVGSIATGYGLTSGGAPLFGTAGSVVNGVPNPATPSLFMNMRRSITPATNFLGS